MASAAIAGFFIVVIAGGVGLGVASADSSDDLARAGAFGFDEATHAATLSDASSEFPRDQKGQSPADDPAALHGAPTRDLSAGFKMVDEREATEKERRQEENAAAMARVEKQKAMQGAETSQDGSASKEKGEVLEYDLPKVDWTVGKEAFVTEWTQRIDAYLDGSNLDGYGAVFAEAAWEHGVDPRWSPAVSNTESGKGSRCFLPHNAWGWGENSWPDWSTAIRAHVAGLAEVYGYSVTFSAAQKYCPPNYVNWYNNTVSQMAII